MNYYLLEADLRLPAIAAIGSVPQGIEPLEWIRGRKLPTPNQQPLKLVLSAESGDEPTDFVGSLLTVFSDDLRTALTEFGIDNIDYFPAELEHPLTHSVRGGYWLVNIIGAVQALDIARSVIVPRPSGAQGKIKSFHVDADKAGKLNIFRLAEDPTLIIISEALRKHLQAQDLGAVRMRHTKNYDGP